MELIPFGLYLAALVLLLPAAPIAIACLLLNHLVVTRNPLRVFYDVLRTIVWFLPLVALVFLSLLACAFFPTARHFGAIVIAVLNLAIASIILFSVNRRGEAHAHVGTQALILLPTLTSLCLAASLACRLF